MSKGKPHYRVRTVDDDGMRDYDEHSEAVDRFKLEVERIQGMSDRNELGDGCVELSIVLDQFNIGED